jgi:ferritin-like metal-binding protein YciE
MMEEDFDEPTLDACLVAGAQRVEHYEIAAYGSLIAWAKAMGHDTAVELLNQTLEEEKAADEKLTSIAEDGLNAEAAELAHPDTAGEEDAQARKPVSSQKKQTGKARVASRS